MSKPERAELLGISERQVTRLENGQAVIRDEVLQLVSERTGVPGWFFRTGWEVPPVADEPDLRETVEALQHRLDTLERATRGDALSVFRQALPGLVPELRQALVEAPSPQHASGRPDRSSEGDGA